MPKTVEELEQEFEHMKGVYDGQISSLTEKLDTATAHATSLTGDNKKLIKDLEAYKKAERDALEAQVHSIKKDLDVSKWSDERIDGFLEGSKVETQEEHSVGQTNAPPAGAGTPSDPKDKVKAFLDA